MQWMNDEVRAKVRAVMQEQNLSQGQLAKKIGLERPAVTRLLSGRVGRLPDNWQRVLDALGLELTVQPKER